MTMMLLQFGSGNIGRGFMGHLFWEAGHDVLFVDKDYNLVRLINERREYPLRVLDAYKKEVVEFVVRGVHAISAEDKEAVATSFARADWVGTAVGIENYPAVASVLVEGIRKRKERGAPPIDVYLCENDLAAHTRMQQALEPYLDDHLKKWIGGNVGFVRVSVARMVKGKEKEDQDPLLVVADAYREFPYDALARKGVPPGLESVKPVTHFEAEFRRKIYIYNLGHAVLAYLGYLRGYRYVHEGFGDGWVSAVFDGALKETTMALFRKYPGIFDVVEHARVLHDVRTRFGNSLLKDPIFRVARNPIRKLGPSDRLIGSALLCLEQGVFPEHIATACAATFLYDWSEDSEACRLQDYIRAKGIETVLQEVTTIKLQSSLGKKIVEEYHKLKTFREG